MDRNSKLKQIMWNTIFWISLFVALYLSYAVYFVNTVTTKSKWIGLFSGAIAILLAAVKFVENVYSYSKNPDLIKKIKLYFSGLDGFFVKSAKTILVLVVFFSIFTYKIIGPQFVCAFLIGIVCSIFLNVNNYHALFSTSFREAFDFQNQESFKRIYNTSLSSALLMYGVMLALCVIIYHMYKDYQMLAGFSLGVCVCGFIFSLCSVISKKVTSASGDLLEESEYRNSEERKLLVFADDINKGITPSIYQTNNILMSCAGILIAAISVGMYCMEIMASFLPIVIVTNALFASTFIAALIRLTKKTDYIKLLIVSMLAEIVLFNAINYFTIKFWLPSCINLLYCLILGSLLGFFAICYLIRNIFYSDKLSSKLINSASIGIKNLIVQCVKDSCKKTIIPSGLIFASVLLSFWLAYGLENPLLGLWGVILCAIGFLCSAFLPVVFMYLSQHLVNINNFSDMFNKELDLSLIKETGKKFSLVFNKYLNFSVVIVVIALILSYSVVADLEEIDLINPYVISSLILGAGIPFIFVYFCINNVIKNSKKIIFETKKELKYHLQNQELSDGIFKLTVKKLSENISTEVGFSVGIVLLIFFFIAILLKTEALAGFLIGILVSYTGINFIITNASVILKLAQNALDIESIEQTNSAGFENLNVADEVFSFTKNFLSPVLNLLILFLSIVCFAIIPVLISFIK